MKSFKALIKNKEGKWQFYTRVAAEDETTARLILAQFNLPVGLRLQEETKKEEDE